VKTIDEYAIDLIVKGTQHLAEDDLNEDGEIAEENHHAACDLALRLADAIQDNPKAVFALVAVEELSRVSESVEDAVSTLDRLRTEHERKGLFQGALAYQGAAELVKQALRGGGQE
jgi:hypothetical protein